MNEITSRQYNNDEVNRIIRRALKLEREDTISHQDLIETAQEILSARVSWILVFLDLAE